MATAAQNRTGFETSQASSMGFYPYNAPVFESVNEFAYAADVTKTIRNVAGVGSGVSAPTTLGQTVPGGGMTFSFPAIADDEINIIDPGQSIQVKAGAWFETQFVVANSHPDELTWAYGWHTTEAATVLDSIDDGIVVHSAAGSTTVNILVYKSGTLEQTITTDVTVGVDPVVFALRLQVDASATNAAVQLFVNGFRAKLNGSSDSDAALIAVADIPTAALLAFAGIRQPAADPVGATWKIAKIGTRGTTGYSGGFFAFGDNAGDGSGTTGGGTSSGGGPGYGDTGADE